VRVILRYHHTSAPHLGKWGLYWLVHFVLWCNLATTMMPYLHYRKKRIQHSKHFMRMSTSATSKWLLCKSCCTCKSTCWCLVTTVANIQNGRLVVTILSPWYSSWIERRGSTKKFVGWPAIARIAQVCLKPYLWK
jgi:hypothetical protein